MTPATDSPWQHLPKTWFDKGTALEVISTCFQSAVQDIRIASGFFTIRGWGFIRRYTSDKQVYLLVGIEDPGEDRARKALIQEIMRDLRTGLDRDRRQAVIDLVAKMQAGQFKLLDARALNHHAKIYLVDHAVGIIGSSNTTGRGLLEQIESGALVTDTQEISDRIQDFETYFALAKDLTQELLDALMRWLKLATPWDIYLKTMLALEDLQPIKMTYKKQPVSYQVDMIAQALRQIRDYEGSMLVASTGLGKTIVAIHVALHLKQEGLIDSVVVIGPKAVKKTWEKELRAASLHNEYFVRQILDKQSSAQARDLEVFEEVVESAKDKRWLLVIDESHELRNRYPKNFNNLRTRKRQRQAFERLTSMIKTGNVKVLLLSGSPYAKDIENLNNQLYLLPHHAENRSLLKESEFLEKDWRISETDEFIQLPVASQLTTPHVARYYGRHDEQGTYIQYGDERRYIPKVKLVSVDFPLMFHDEMAELIRQGYFDMKAKHMGRKNIERLVRVAWTSSPLALKSILERVFDTPGGDNAFKFSKEDRGEFSVSQAERQASLQPIIDKVGDDFYTKDSKLLLLTKILREQAETTKTIIFCERRATVAYLANKLPKLLPEFNVAATISDNGSDFEMKEASEIEQLIKDFAPIANEVKNETGIVWDIFVSTDAHGVGVNMQDASVVINYDLDWTPIAPIQRAGRILRLWKDPRIISVYTFVPLLPEKQSIDELRVIRNRWNQLLDRHKASTQITDIPVLTDSQSQDLSMLDLASRPTIRSVDLDLQEVEGLETSPYYKHTAKLQLYREYAKVLPNDLVSARTYSGSHPILYVLIKIDKEYKGILYRPHNKEMSSPDSVHILDLIACEEDTPIAIVDPEEIEQLADDCINGWCEQNRINAEDVLRECILYLKPHHLEDELQEILVDQP
ncbi:helicase-related protein [Nodosilinea sp. PGN35]|uniref:helicase-related protein n=1 Tax=Nodosilinea sp. PGN35 TaxID=3020489 RepID=UPI0023B34D95|nr:helicase-related protein [Nodosilinea sp. TSF1-S3]MDF0369693.1 helicase-related protein [Nodosilinea sp. TSF1-S3]